MHKKYISTSKKKVLNSTKNGGKNCTRNTGITGPPDYTISKKRKKIPAGCQHCHHQNKKKCLRKKKKITFLVVPGSELPAILEYFLWRNILSVFWMQSPREKGVWCCVTLPHPNRHGMGPCHPRFLSNLNCVNRAACCWKVFGPKKILRIVLVKRDNVGVSYLRCLRLLRG